MPVKLDQVDKEKNGHYSKGESKREMEKRKENGVRKCPIAIYEATPLPSHEAHVPLARFMLNRDAHCPNLRLELPMHSFEPCSTNNGEGNEGIEIYERPGGQTVINVFFYLFFSWEP